MAKSAGAQQVLLEIEAMKLMEHPFILQLYCTWQTPTDLVLLLDYMPGVCSFFKIFSLFFVCLTRFPNHHRFRPCCDIQNT